VRSRPGLGSSFVLWLPSADAAQAAAASEAAPAALPPEQDPQRALVEVSDEEGAGIGRIADALATEVERIVSMFSARLRVDPGTPSAHGAPDTEVQNHTVTFLADLAACLRVVGRDGDAAELLLRDGSAIQRLIARRHGRQRRKIGWAEEEIRREYAVLTEEVRGAVERRTARAGSRGEVERALAVLAHFLGEAERESLEAYREAGNGE
jgi:hypothetical protein